MSKGWAVVTKHGKIDVDSIHLKKSDVFITIADEQAGAKIRRVDCVLVDASPKSEIKWISVKDALPQCNPKPGSFGLEVLIFPSTKVPGTADLNTAFFGRRVTDKPCFYRFGATLHNVQKWAYIPRPQD